MARKCTAPAALLANNDLIAAVSEIQKGKITSSDKLCL